MAALIRGFGRRRRAAAEPDEPDEEPLDLSNAPERVKLVLVRHGERADEVRGHPWLAQHGEGDRWFDPPLTDTGKAQARRRGEALAELGADRLFVSPLLRTVETAHEISRVVERPLHRVFGLASCAAAIMRHGFDQLPPLEGEALERAVPGVQVLATDAEPHAFERACERLCRRAAAQGDALVVCVTHREGLRDLSAEAGAPFRRTPYCCRADFEYKVGAQEWEVVGVPSDFDLGG